MAEVYEMGELYEETAEPKGDRTAAATGIDAWT
jgi:hypothetical protein